ncbi:MAG: hypothetical protein ACXW25_11235 [Rhodospirillales bacterium]
MRAKRMIVVKDERCPILVVCHDDRVYALDMMVARTMGRPASSARRQKPSSSTVSLFPARPASVSHVPSSERLARPRGYPAAAR